MSKKENILSKLPEVSNDTKERFNYWKTPVLEGASNQGGDARQDFGLVAGDITQDDIKELVKHALTLIDKRVLEQGRPEAIYDAALMAVNTFEEGKWQSKVNPGTLDLIMAQMDKGLSGNKEKKIEKSEDQNDKVMDMAPKTATSDVSQLSGGRVRKVPQAKVLRTIKENVAPGAMPAVRKELSSGTPLLVLASLMSRLDKVAGSLQEGGRNDLAEELDRVANTIDESIEGV
jgi:hypothetical protein